MKARKKLISIALCTSLVIGLTGCSENGSNPDVTTIDDDIRNPVTIDEFVDPNAKPLENPNLVYFGYYDMRTAGDIKPGVKLFEKTYGGTIEYKTVAWAERIEKLQAMIAGNEAPDLVDVEGLSFPAFMSQNVYTDMTEYFEPYMSQPQWTDGYKELIERYSYEGKHFYYPFTVNALPNCLIYDAVRFDSLGIDNPKELYENNQWDWNSFKSIMAEFMRLNPDAVGGVQGMVSSEIFLSTGIPLVSVDDGVVTSNFTNSTIDRAANFLMELRKEKFAVRGDGMWSNEPGPLANGKVAFLGVGQWKITDFCKDYPDRTFEFVPFPRDPLADKYYYNTSTFGYMVPNGAPNPEGAAAFINIMRSCQVDPELRAVTEQSIMNDKQYSQEQFDFLMSFENIDNYDLVLESVYGFSSDLSSIVDKMLTDVAFSNDDDKSWAQMCSEQEGVINAYLSEYSK